ncbi:hypothetical protein Csa_022855 [Cucumis sativus]|uniref:Uncharacterized protein n=1 Tax=Cucumis sativus TaxID=3659 RepID=A0A0A0LSP9_CUCSA|nr:hypothetical protein Csa_022855 [Cucumis sativus]
MESSCVNRGKLVIKKRLLVERPQTSSARLRPSMSQLCPERLRLRLSYRNLGLIVAISLQFPLRYLIAFCWFMFLNNSSSSNTWMKG